MSVVYGRQKQLPTYYIDFYYINTGLKKNQSTPRPSEHLPVKGGKMSKGLGGIKEGCKKYKISSWHFKQVPRCR